MFLVPSVFGRPYLYSDSATVSVSSRIVAVLTVHLQENILYQALSEAVRRFPQLAVSPAVSGSEYCFQPASGNLAIFRADDPDQPECFGDSRLGGYLFKVSYLHKTLFFDFHKSIADEYGMMTFAKSVLYRYLELSGFPLENDGTVKLMSSTYFSAEGDDPMEKLAEIPASRPVWYMDAEALRLTQHSAESERVVTVRIPISKLRSGLEQFSRTPVTYLAPVFSEAVSELEDPSRDQGKYVVASIMVNLRPYFPAASLRPFCTPVYLAYNRRLTEYPYNTVLMSQKKLLEAQLKSDALAYSAERTASLIEKAVDGAGTLEQKKNMVLEMHQQMAAHSTYSICRVGNIILPDSMQRLVTDFYPVIPSGNQAYALSVVTYRGEIIVSVSGKSDTWAVTRRFVELLNSNMIDAYLSDEYIFSPMNYHP